LADELEIPGSADQLYLYRGDEVNPHRPLLQGDVFDQTAIPGVDDNPAMAIVTTHACDMRGEDGVVLAEHLHLARVDLKLDPHPLGYWFRGSFGEMPLPDLLGAGQGAYVANLDLIGRAPTASLGPRVACLDLYGITILQQRIVNRSSRVKISKVQFQEQNAGVFAEAELMEEWIEASDKFGVGRGEAEETFHEFMRKPRGDEPPLQTQLKDEGRRPHVRQVVRQETASRFSDTATGPT
jgi:hypothetical protein